MNRPDPVSSLIHEINLKAQLGDQRAEELKQAAAETVGLIKSMYNEDEKRIDIIVEATYLALNIISAIVLILGLLTQTENYVALIVSILLVHAIVSSYRTKWQNELLDYLWLKKETERMQILSASAKALLRSKKELDYYGYMLRQEF